MTRGIVFAGVVSLVGSLAVACGGGSTPPPGGSDGGRSSVQASCDHRATGATTCLDYQGYPASEIASQEMMCMTRGETWSTAPCNRSGAIGGCRYVVGGFTNTYWYYSGDVASLMTSCTSTSDATWVTP